MRDQKISRFFAEIEVHTYTPNHGNSSKLCFILFTFGILLTIPFLISILQCAYVTSTKAVTTTGATPSSNSTISPISSRYL